MRGWKLFRSRLPMMPFGCVIAPLSPVSGIDRVRIELRLLVVLGLERRRVGPAQAQVQRQVRPHFPVVLEVQFVIPQARQEESLRLA